MSGRPQRAAASLWLSIITVLALVAGCGDDSATTRPIDAEYLPDRWLSIHRPPIAADAAIVVIVHGAGLDRHDYGELAGRLADQGAVVFTVDWDVFAPATPIAVEEIACAVRYARLHGPEYGGGAERLVLVGHSTGAIYSGAAATGTEEPNPGCPWTASSRPDGLVLISAAQVPGGAPWRYTSMDADAGLRIAVLHGRDDTVASPRLSERTFEVLDDVGYDVSLELVPGGHRDLVLVDPATSGQSETAPNPTSAEVTVSTILDLVPPTDR